MPQTARARTHCRSPSIPDATAPPSANACASRTRNASISPSGACASATSPAPSSRTPWRCRELTVAMRDAGDPLPARRPRRASPAWLGSVLHVQRLRRILGWLDQARLLLHALPQRAAEGDVDFLKPAADAQHRHCRRRWPGESAAASSHRGPDRAACPAGWARPGNAAARRWSGLPVSSRPSTASSSSCKLQLTADRGDQQRQRAGSIQHGGDVLLADSMERVRTQHSPVRRNPDNWSRGSHQCCV